MTGELYHFTCHHGAQRILEDMTVRPGTGGYLKVSWWTDLEYPDRAALGLTSHTLGCDRGEFRFTLTDPAQAVRWGHVRSAAPRALVDAYELAPGAAPAHWFVAHVPVSVHGYTPVRGLRGGPRTA